MRKSRRMRRLKLLVGIPLALVLVAVAGSFVYVNFIADDAPERLTVDRDEPARGTTGTTGTAPTETGVDGEWNVAGGSQAGYRVEEILFGQSATAVGRTTDVSGSMTISGQAVTAGSFTVQLANVASDEGRRDNQFRGRIMDVANHPTATFELGRPIELGTLPGDGETVRVDAVGDLTLRGTTKTVTVPLEAKRSGATIEVAGSFEVVFADWGIPNPSFGPAQVGDVGELEFLLVLARA
jgi:polyisoprenoid-binding protein YceI